MKSRLTVFFGGTFDPPHLGHHEMAKSLIDSSGIEKIYLVPTFQNPLKPLYKSGSPEEPFADPLERLKWCQLWAEELRKYALEINVSVNIICLDVEVMSTKPCFTVDTLELLAQRDHLELGQTVLVMGSDQISGLEKWKSSPELFSKLHSVWIFRRGNFEWHPNLIPESLRGKFALRIMGQEIPNVNSTEIRVMLRRIPGETNGEANSALLKEEFLKLPIVPSVKKQIVARLGF